MIATNNSVAGQATYNKSYDEMLDRNVKILELYNKVAFEKGMAPVNVSEYEKSFDPSKAEYNKGLDGTTTVARGTRLLQTNYNNRIRTLAPQGGVFEEAGAEVLRDEPGSVLQFFGHSQGVGSGYSPLSTAASATWAALPEVTNDQTGTIINEQASMAGYVVETWIRKQVLQGFLGSADDIIALFEDNFMARDELHNDELGADSIVLNANIAGTALSGATTGNLAQTFLNIRASLQALGTTNIDLHLSPNGYNQFISEREASTGQFLLFRMGDGNIMQLDPIRNTDGSAKSSGLVGVLDGSRVYINNGIRNTYTTVGNNITVTTGGSSTAMIVGDSRLLGIGSGKEDLNQTEIINNTEATLRKGAIIVGRTRFAGATPIIPQAFGYAAF